MMPEECEKCNGEGLDLFECKKDSVLDWFICVDCMRQYIKSLIEDAEYWEVLSFDLQ